MSRRQLAAFDCSLVQPGQHATFIHSYTWKEVAFFHIDEVTTITHVSFDILDLRLLVLRREDGIETPDSFADGVRCADEILGVEPDDLEFKPLESLKKKKKVTDFDERDETTSYHMLYDTIRNNLLLYLCVEGKETKKKKKRREWKTLNFEVQYFE